MPSPFVGLVLIRPVPPCLPSPPMNSLPPRRCPIFLDGVVGVTGEGRVGESGGVSKVAVPLPVADGLNVKSGRTLADLRWLMPAVECRFAVGRI